MGLVINTNVSALTSAAALNKSGDSLQTSMERLSTGKEINSAADNAAGKAISTNMTKQINMLEQGIDNAKDGSNLLATMDSAASEIENMTQRMTQLAMQASNDTYSSDDKALLDTEYQQLMEEVDRVSGNTEFNGTNLIDGSTLDLNLQVTTDSSISLTGTNLTTAGLGLTNTGISGTGTAGSAAAINGAGVTGGGALTAVTDSTLHYLKVGFTDENGIGKQLDVDLNALAAQDYRLSGAMTTDGAKALEDALNAQLKTAGLDEDIHFEVSHDSAGVMTVSVSANTENNGTIEIDALGSAATDLGFPAASTTDAGAVGTLKDPSVALTQLEDALKEIVDSRTSFGAQTNRLDYTATALEDAVTNTSAARSQIEDADFAKETTNLARAKVLQNAGIAMLQQANSQTSNVEQLLR